MTKEKALEIVLQTIKTKSKKNTVVIKDGLQFRIAITVLSLNYTPKQIKQLLKQG